MTAVAVALLGLTSLALIGGAVAFAMRDQCADIKNSDKDVGAQCYKQIWKAAGCTTGNHPDGYTKWHKTQTRAQLRDDAKQWATLTDDKHEKGCYGSSESFYAGFHAMKR